jgi:hypothetical protein
MQIKVVTVDFRLSQNAKRAIRWGLLPLAVLIGSMALARAYDTSWIASGQQVSASKLKGDLDEVQTRLTALEQPAAGLWKPYTVQLVDANNPTQTITTGVANHVAFYRQVGDSIEVRIYTDFSSMPTISATLGWTLPPNFAIDETKLPARTAGYVFRDVLGVAAGGLPGNTPEFVGVVGTVQSSSVVSVTFHGDDAALSTSGVTGTFSIVTLAFTVPVTSS